MASVMRFEFFLAFNMVRQMLLLMCLIFMNHNQYTMFIVKGIHESYTFFTQGHADEATNLEEYGYKCKLPYYYAEQKIECSFMYNRVSLWFFLVAVFTIVKLVVSALAKGAEYKRRKQGGYVLPGEVEASQVKRSGKIKPKLSAVEKINLLIHPKFYFYVGECAFFDFTILGSLMIQYDAYNTWNLIFIVLGLSMVLVNTLIVIFVTVFIFFIVKKKSQRAQKLAKFASNFAFVLNLKKKLTTTNKLYPLLIKFIQWATFLFIVLSGH